MASMNTSNLSPSVLGVSIGERAAHAARPGVATSDVVKVHAPVGAPSPWVMRFAPLIKPGGTVLDYASGSGRHAFALASLGYRVEAVDRDTSALREWRDAQSIVVREADLEADKWPFGAQRYDAIVVTNYLYRPYFVHMLDLLGESGVLLYETFMLGNERFGRPKNPDFLLQPGELYERLRDGFTVVAFEQGEVATPAPAMVQRVCAVRGAGRVGQLP